MKPISKLKLEFYTDVPSFADKLVKKIGYRKAINTCMENQWFGVQQQLQKYIQHQ